MLRYQGSGCVQKGKAGREGSKTRQGDRSRTCRAGNGGQDTEEVGQSRETVLDSPTPSAFTCKGSFWSPASSLWSHNRSCDCEDNLSPALPSPQSVCSVIPGTSLSTPSSASTLLRLLTLARVRCRLLWSLPRKSIALGVPGGWLARPAGRVQLSALGPLHSRPPPPSCPPSLQLT